MAKHKYMRSPPNLTGMPPGVPYIIGNEAAERFSYYGMKSVLTVFMAHYILNQSGVLAPMRPNEAYNVHALFCFRRLFPSDSRRDYRRRLARQILDHPVAFDRLLLWQPHTCLNGHFLGNCHWATDDARNRIDAYLFGRWRHQTMRVGERWRSIWRLEQASAFKDVWLVLFLDQRRLLHFFASLSLASQESEVRTGMGVWNPWNRDVDRDFVLLGRSQENGARAAGGTWLSARNIQQGRSHHARANRNGLRFHFGFLGLVGNEQRRRMDVASRENGSARVLAAVDQY